MSVRAMLPFLAIGLLTLIFVNATSSQSFDSDDKLSNAVKVPAAILAQLKTAEEVKQCLETGDGEDKVQASWFQASAVNLNDDRRADYVVRSDKDCLSGPRAANWWIFSRNRRGFKLVFHDSVLWLGISERKTLGYRDIRTETTMVNIIRNRWTYNGRGYKLTSGKIIEPGK